MNRLLRLALAALLLSTLPGCARAQTLVDLQLRDLDSGATLPQYPHAGRRYVEGQPGHRYAVSLRNLTGERVLAVVSVDGVNAISGQTAGSSQSGYVLEPWQQLEVRGWRKSMADVAEFYFTDLGDSYAARTGRPQNVGVIGVAAFRERRPEPIGYDQAYPSSAPLAKASADAASGARAERQAPAQELGTGHGERRYDPATLTHFERESSRPNQQSVVYYDSFEALAARGILPRRYPGYEREPEAFPVGFAPDP